MKVLHVVGARPNYMKIAPIMAEMAKHPQTFQQVLVHTGQHYDQNMSDVFFRDLNLPHPDIDLGIGSGTHATQTAHIILAFDQVVQEWAPDWVVVVGDTNSTLACALVGAKLDIKVAHVEAGLRSWDRTMPEEINRILTDAIADLLFTPSRDANANLLREGIPNTKVFFVGNVMIDTLVRFRSQALKSSILNKLNLKPKDYIVVTLHRPSNVDNCETLRGICRALSQLARHRLVVFPVHPRTRARITEFGLNGEITGLKVTQPLGYLDFLCLTTNSLLVLTDSGGLQEETTFLGIPCLTLRENTERPITVTQGTNEVIGVRPEVIVAEALAQLGKPQAMPKAPELWDGRAGQRIVNVFQQLSG